MIDYVGPLPKAKAGNQYLLAIMCTLISFPEAVPLRSIKAKTIVKALVNFLHFWSLTGYPLRPRFQFYVQQVMHQLVCEQFKSSAYYLQSQGALEWFHQTLKNMLRK